MAGKARKNIRESCPGLAMILTDWCTHLGGWTPFRRRLAPSKQSPLKSEEHPRRRYDDKCPATSHSCVHRAIRKTRIAISWGTVSGDVGWTRNSDLHVTQRLPTTILVSGQQLPPHRLDGVHWGARGAQRLLKTKLVRPPSSCVWGSFASRMVVVQITASEPRATVWQSSAIALSWKVRILGRPDIAVIIYGTGSVHPRDVERQSKSRPVDAPFGLDASATPSILDTPPTLR
ncbi:hypothetical protein BDZ89DRAFT_1054423 [Hymenopellis radicata]|nr:hypothetical protein BDZ89DRAFT_1054423 [Hymenopellis radicata]